ncbi:hypothetical protein [Paraburkholderia sp. SIMBA_054]|uniref:hypothetical protein n=1 Tax=Paraburkholderia sp. SIMBA_054 TaxID=3085795 RepID=UPI003977E479
MNENLAISHSAIAEQQVANALSVPNLLAVLREARAWFSTDGPLAKQMDAVIAGVSAASSPEATLRSILITKAIASLASRGDIYTDDHGHEPSVAAAGNIDILSDMLCGSETTEILKGILLADSESISDVTVCVDGSIRWEAPADIECCGRTWQLRLADGTLFAVDAYEPIQDYEARWVVKDAATFYQHLLSITHDLMTVVTAAT